MNKLSNTSKLIILAVVVVVAVILLAVFGGGSSSPSGTPAPQNPTVAAGNGNPTTAPTTGGTSGGTGSTAGKPPVQAPVPASSNTLITPVPGVTWKIATQNEVSWTKEAGVSGQIELLDATSKQLVGVILNQVGVHQTSYSWNTRDLLVSRSSPTKITVQPGRYIIKIVFDGNGVASITSQPMTISQ